ncbi:MAG: DUF309 domain-containing protein [Planctomycetaceae bacterium]|nr:DUF309 domain-containing protein [Planctomycetaceae bacterium]
MFRLVPERSLPPYTYVPGQTPHPVSDPSGHMFGRRQMHVDFPRESDVWAREFLFGIDLFHHGFYWEAHETWEGLWHAAGRARSWADLLKGLIKLAAAGVKAREGRREGVRRHALRAAELVRQAQTEWRDAALPTSDWNWTQLLAHIDSVVADPPVAVTPDPRGHCVWGWQIVDAQRQGA